MQASARLQNVLARSLGQPLKTFMKKIGFRNARVGAFAERAGAQFGAASADPYNKITIPTRARQRVRKTFWRLD